MKYYRSIIKDSTMHEKNQFRYRKKLVLTSQKARLNITKYQKNIAQKQARSLGIHCPYYGHSLPHLLATVARFTGNGCPCAGVTFPDFPSLWRKYGKKKLMRLP